DFLPDNNSISSAKDIKNRKRTGAQVRLNPIVKNRDGLLITLNAHLDMSDIEQPHINTDGSDIKKTGARTSFSSPEALDPEALYSLPHALNIEEFISTIINEIQEPALMGGVSKRVSEKFSFGAKMGISYITRDGNSERNIKSDGTPYIPVMRSLAVTDNTVKVVTPEAGFCFFPSEKLESGIFARYTWGEMNHDSVSNAPISDNTVGRYTRIFHLYKPRGLSGGGHIIIHPNDILKAGLRMEQVQLTIGDNFDHLIRLWNESGNSVIKGEKQLCRSSRTNAGVSIRYSGEKRNIPLIAAFGYDFIHHSVYEVDNSLEILLGSKYLAWDSTDTISRSEKYLKDSSLLLYNNSALSRADIFKSLLNTKHNLRLGMAYNDFKKIMIGVQYEYLQVRDNYSYNGKNDFAARGKNHQVKLGAEYLIDSLVGLRFGISHTIHDDNDATPEELLLKVPAQFLSRDLMYIGDFNNTRLTCGAGFLYNLLELEFSISYDMLKTGEDFRYYKPSNQGILFEPGELKVNRVSVDFQASKHF
ncbi:MAG: hypothetical protein ABIA63_03410, partial [bacterium]